MPIFDKGTGVPISECAYMRGNRVLLYMKQLKLRKRSALLSITLILAQFSILSAFPHILNL